MADFTDLIDDDLEDGFDAPVYKPEKHRKRMVSLIKKVREQHGKGQTRGKLMWRVGNNDAISFSPVLSGSPVMIAGKTTNYVPAERFGDFLDKLEKAVTEGKLDDEIQDAVEGDATPQSNAKRARGTTGASKDPNHPKFTDPNWSTYSSGERIKRGLAYKAEQEG
ncbi:hypothetical protein [Qipengyuania atrilutea]|uniref:Uncharacterized protein n=1 Tax=Qipengyuania atrilutea TaxID=2744473 RepID=A0A850H2E1_9SPHN|nr:hypothetical protein [Actirhodobacter atriluteus]NVD44846.1 hypothetical protein [Actirhodobacter atriluteus]